jgi:hypothetical protein
MNSKKAKQLRHAAMVLHMAQVQSGKPTTPLNTIYKQLKTIHKTTSHADRNRGLQRNA